MTGFGRGSASGEGFSIAVELKTVNNRFLDLHLRLPSEFAEIESDIKKIISDEISRGRVDVNLQYENTGPVEYELNRPLIAGYLSVMKGLREEFSLRGEPELSQIARLPGALQVKKEAMSREFAEGVRTAFGLALKALIEMRNAEGKSLEEELGSLLGNISSRIPLIESKTEDVAEEYAARLTNKINTLLGKIEVDAELDQSRLAQEVAYLSEKSDISEELARLKSHVEQFRSIVADNGPIGKRLDFLTQELNREANTISSKTQNLEIKEAALFIKAEIEKIREQVQNIE